MTADLESLGLREEVLQRFEEVAPAGSELARATCVERGFATVVSARGEASVHVPKGMLRSIEQTPVTGDWLAIDPQKQSVAKVLPRFSAVLRGAAGRRDEPQVVAANVDWVFVLMGLDGDYNLRRLERYLTLVADSGAEPVVFLTKAGLVADWPDRAREVSAIAERVHAIDVKSGIDQDLPRKYLGRGVTAALLGSSGVGKSTLANHLKHSTVAKTQPVRERDDRGKHTTSRRELFVLEEGGVIIDTPGMRELSLWGDRDSLDVSFPDVAALALGCKFTDCRHTGEPGCAVQKALANGTIDLARFASYQALLAEVLGQDSRRRPARTSERPSARPPRAKK
jgi:ribosome biogenesis GTPase / thiamine phosphate phosphatase